MGAEFYFIFLIYLSSTFGFIFLNQAYKLNQTWKKLIIMILGIIIVFTSTSVLILMFEAKIQGNGYYPYGISTFFKINLFSQK